MIKAKRNIGNYCGAQYYNPELSVCLGVDPLENNPIMRIDPDGNWPDRASLSSWYTAVFKKSASNMAQNKFNEMADRTANQDKFEKLKSAYNQALHDFNRKWDGK